MKCRSAGSDNRTLALVHYNLAIKHRITRIILTTPKAIQSILSDRSVRHCGLQNTYSDTSCETHREIHVIIARNFNIVIASNTQVIFDSIEISS